LTSQVIHYGGGDGIKHEAFGHRILFPAMDGNWHEALRGAESAFYFMPGLRYFRALEKAVFGETEHAMLLVVLALPFLVYWLVSLVTNRWVGAAAAFVFTFTAAGKYVGFAFYRHAAEATVGHGEPVGYGAMLAALCLAILAYRRSVGGGSAAGMLFASGLLFATAVFMRPNMAPGIAVFCVALSLPLLRRGAVPAVAVWALGVGFAAVMPLHNYYFGDQFVLFTRAATIPENLKAPPSVYLAALSEMAGGRFDGPAFAVVWDQLDKWGGPFKVLLFAVTLAAAAGWRRPAVEVRALAAAALALHAVLWFYHPNDRYEFMAWLLTVVVCIVLADRAVGEGTLRLPARWAGKVQAGAARAAGWLGVGDMARRAGLCRQLIPATDRMSALSGFKAFCRPLVSPVHGTLERLSGRGSLFDVGCGSGALLYLAAADGGRGVWVARR